MTPRSCQMVRGLLPIGCLALLVGCGGDSLSTGGNPNQAIGGAGGGAQLGGHAPGGGQTGGTRTGGAGTTGGAQTGGTRTGGAATGGTAMGGTRTGGGGTTGGAAMGGTRTGGAGTTGGAQTGGTGTTGGAQTGGTGGCAFTPCGGNLVGTWTWQSLCGDLVAGLQSMFSAYPNCGGVIQSVTQRDVTEVITFATDGSFSGSSSGTADVGMLLTEGCLSDMVGLSVTLSPSLCDAYAAGLLEDPNTAAATCTYATGRCTCQYTSTSEVTESGTYSVSGSTVTFMSGGNSSDGQFCVESSSLKLRAPTGMVTTYGR